MMLNSSPRESWRSRSARVSVSLTSYMRRLATGFTEAMRGQIERTSSRLIVADRLVFGT